MLAKPGGRRVTPIQYHSRLPQRRATALVQAFVPQPPVEALDVFVLLRLARRSFLPAHASTRNCRPSDTVSDTNSGDRRWLGRPAPVCPRPSCDRHGGASANAPRLRTPQPNVVPHHVPATAPSAARQGLQPPRNAASPGRTKRWRTPVQPAPNTRSASGCPASPRTVASSALRSPPPTLAADALRTPPAPELGSSTDRC